MAVSASPLSPACIVAALILLGSFCFTEAVLHPTDLCGLVFKNSLSTIPTFTLTSRGDTKYGTPIVSILGGHHVIEGGNTGDKAYVVPSTATKYTPYSTITAGKTVNGIFYVSSNKTYGAQLVSRTFNDASVFKFAKGKLFLLHLTSFFFANGTNFNDGDGKTIIPQNKRCILFRTAA